MDVEHKVAQSTLYGVFKDGKIKSYDSAAEAFHAAQQNGGWPFKHYMGWSTSYAITRASLNKGMTTTYINTNGKYIEYSRRKKKD